MITELRISGLRGIRDGDLKEMGPLVVLVGPNGCGKSTVLDALLIGAGNNPGDAVGRAVRRRPFSWNGSRWLFSRQNEDRVASIDVHRPSRHADETRKTIIRWEETPLQDLAQQLAQHHAPLPYSGITIETQATGAKREAHVGFAASNAYRITLAGERIIGWEIRLIDSPQGTNQSLDEVYSTAVERGRKDQAVEALRHVLGDDIRDITLLTDNHVPVVHVVYADGSVPVSLAGEGIISLVRISLELSARPGGIVLLEEPEAHQHPRIIWQTARIIWATVQRGVQIVLSTHSLELLDALLAEAPEGKLPDLSVYRLNLDRGNLIHHRIGGEDVATMRADFEDDLR